MAKQKKRLEKALKRAGSFITGKEAAKISKKFDIPEIQIAQRAAERLSDKGKATSFSRALAQRLQRQAQTMLPDPRYGEAGPGGATLDPGTTLFRNLGRLQSMGQAKRLGVSEQFARNIANFDKFGKGQMLTIGKKGTGAILPERRTKGGGGKKKKPQVPEAPAYDYGGMDMGFGDFDFGLSDSDQNYMNLIAQQQAMMSEMLGQAIAGLGQPTPINFPEPQQAPIIYGAGDNYNVQGVRAPSRPSMSRSDYLRNTMGISSIAPSLLTTAAGGINI